MSDGTRLISGFGSTHSTYLIISLLILYLVTGDVVGVESEEVRLWASEGPLNCLDTEAKTHEAFASDRPQRRYWPEHLRLFGKSLHLPWDLEIPNICHPSSNVESRRYWRYCICEVIAVKHSKTPVSYPTRPTPVFCDFCGRLGCLWSVLGRSGIQGMPGFCSLEKFENAWAKSCQVHVLQSLQSLQSLQRVTSGNDTCATHWVSVHVSVFWTLGCALAKQVLITGDADIAARVCRLSGDCSTLHTMCEACSCESLH